MVKAESKALERSWLRETKEKFGIPCWHVHRCRTLGLGEKRGKYRFSEYQCNL